MDFLFVKSGNIMNTKQVLKWLAVLPGGFLAALLVTFPIHWVVVLIQLTDRPDEAIITIGNKGLLASIPPEILERLGYALFVPGVFVAAGARIAPCYQFGTALILAVVVVAFQVSAYILVPLLGYEFTGNTIQRILTPVLQLISVSGGVFYARHDEIHARQLALQEEKHARIAERDARRAELTT